jgi:hypothetical protein
MLADSANVPLLDGDSLSLLRHGGWPMPINHPIIEPVLVTIQAAARMIGNSQWTVRDKIKRGVLDAKKDGKRVLVTVTSIRRHVDGLPAAVLGLGDPVKAAVEGRRRAKRAEAARSGA